MMSGKMYRFRPDERVDSRFLEFWLLSPEAQKRIDAMKTGISDSGLNLTHDRFVQLPVPVPLLHEQRRIVDLLEDHLSRLDAADQYLAAAGRRIKVLVTSVLLGLIPGAEGYPDSWERVTVDEAGDIGLGRQRHPDWHMGPNMKPYLRVANVFEDRIDTSDVMEMHWPGETFDQFKLHPGDVLLNEGQTPDLLGRPAIYRGEPPEIAFTNSLIRFKANHGVLPEFALLVFRRHMRAGRFKRESRITTNIAHLSAARLKPIEFPIPPLDVQGRIVALADERLTAANRLADGLAAARAHRTNLRRSLLDAAFSGRLTGSAADVSVAREMIGA
jgi:type I restriction enzyme S subunit